MDTNPYQSPATPFAPVDGQAPSIRVDGRSLVVPTATILPPVCIKTNQPVSEADMVRRTFYWCSPWVALLILLSGCLVILAYFLVRKRFTITYGLAPDLRQRYRKWLIIKSLAATGFFVALLMAAGVDSPLAALVFLVLFVAAIVSLFIGNAPLSVVNHRRGMFWVKGCSNEYLAQLEGGFEALPSS